MYVPKEHKNDCGSIYVVYDKRVQYTHMYMCIYLSLYMYMYTYTMYTCTCIYMYMYIVIVLFNVTVIRAHVHVQLCSKGSVYMYIVHCVVCSAFSIL